MGLSTQQLTQQRYGGPFTAPLAEGNEVIDLELRHRSVRKFTGKSVSDAQLNLLIAAAQSGSTSSNLQAWSVIAVRDPERKRALSETIGARPYVEDCDVFLVWVADYHRARALTQSRGGEVATLHYLENTLVSFVDSGISAQNALLAAESLGLGGVFVGSIRNNLPEVAHLLGLPKHVAPVVGLAIGHPDPAEEAGIKPRLPQRAVLHHEQYDADAWEQTTAEYEQRLAEYYSSYGEPDYSWAHIIERRIGQLRGLYGREQMRDWLSELGLPSE